MDGYIMCNNASKLRINIGQPAMFAVVIDAILPAGRSGLRDDALEDGGPVVHAFVRRPESHRDRVLAR
jgi:hypothetical protein